MSRGMASETMAMKSNRHIKTSFVAGLFCTLLLSIVSSQHVLGANSDNNEPTINQVIWGVSAGGGSMTGTSIRFKVSGTVSQTVIGRGVDGCNINHGFWQLFCKTADSDCDYIVDSLDNCPNTYNPLQEDYDLDEIGDACDPCNNFPPVLVTMDDTTAIGYFTYFKFFPVVSDPDDESHTIEYVNYPHWCTIQNDSLFGEVPDTSFAETLKVIVEDVCNIDSLQTLVLIYLCGNANGDETINVGDAVFLINYVFKGGPSPIPSEAGDANGDGNSNVGDAVYLINYIFKGGAGPVCPD